MLVCNKQFIKHGLQRIHSSIVFLKRRNSPSFWFQPDIGFSRQCTTKTMIASQLWRQRFLYLCDRSKITSKYSQKISDRRQSNLAVCVGEPALLFDWEGKKRLPHSTCYDLTLSSVTTLLAIRPPARSYCKHTLRLARPKANVAIDHWRVRRQHYIDISNDRYFMFLIYVPCLCPLFEVCGGVCVCVSDCDQAGVCAWSWGHSFISVTEPPVEHCSRQWGILFCRIRQWVT